MIYTFYSFKGGVGRSMALANVGQYLFSRGARVLLIDWDLEAPGLESFFFGPDDPRFGEVRCQLGLIDYLDHYRREYDASRPGARPFEDAIGALRPLDKLLFPLHAGDPALTGGGELWLLPAGWRMSRKPAAAGVAAADDRFSKYAAAVQDFGWSEFYAAYEGERFFNWFRERLLPRTADASAGTAASGFDAVLIDSRTGVTEVGGVCTRQLADVVVSFCAPNYQNLAGAERMAASFVPSDDRRQRGERELQVLVIPARVDEAGETDAQNEFRRRFLAAVHPPRALSESNATAWDLLIPYVTKYAYAEALAVGREDSNQRLEQAYRNLAAHLVLLSGPDSPLRARLSDDLYTIRRRRPRIHVLHAQQNSAAAGRIAGLLQEMVIAAHIGDASSILVCLDGNVAPEVRQQIRLARQRGACVYGVTEEASARPAPGILQRVPVFHLPQQLDELLQQLRTPCQSRRAPQMAPPVAPGYVEWPDHLDHLKGALIPAPEASHVPPLVCLSGPPGSGKTSVAARICADEDVLDCYPDGILWVTPGESGDVLGCLRAIITAFTGETATDGSIRDAAARAAQHLVGAACLLVVDDVVRREHLAPFLQLGQLARLIIPRDPDIIPEAKSISLQFMGNPQATDLLLHQLPSHADRALFSRLAYRTGGWPLALATARGQLSQAVAKGEDVNAAAARLIAALEKEHVAVLGEAAGVLQQRARRRIDAAVHRLTPPEQMLLRDLRAFQDQPTLAIDSFPARWTLGEDQFRHILDTFERHHLIAVDHVRQAIEIPVFVAQYVRDLRDEPEAGARAAFVLRPFGVKGGIDFDQVQRELVDPALTKLGVRSMTSGSFLEAGHVREDMFQLLLTADIVLADVSLPHTGVFYQLGIRHALRPKCTVLLRSANAETPFGLRTDQELTYDPREPARSLEALLRVLQVAVGSGKADSPVFLMMPDLAPVDPSRLHQPPAEFRQDLETAKASRATADLRLFSEEIRELPWAREGLRLVGRAQLDLRSWEGAAQTWEELLARDPQDREAILVLGRVYQRLNRQENAERAVDRALALPDLTRAERAEALALQAASAQARWRQDWQGGKDAPAAALRSPHLRAALTRYIEAFEQDLNQHWSGLSALWLGTMLVELARGIPEVWEEEFASEEEARLQLQKLDAQRRALASAVELAIGASGADSSPDAWVRMGAADLKLLTGGKPRYIAAEYRKAFAGGDPFMLRSLRSQLQMLQSLGVLREAAEAAESTLPPDHALPAAGPTLAVLFFGHMLDRAERAIPRFPPDSEPLVRQALVATLREILTRHPGFQISGLAGASAGGDILFHEVCLELGIASTVCLPVPAREYVATSVQYAGPEWVGRFYRLQQSLPARELARSSGLPGWLKGKPLYSTWERNLSWELYLAMETGREALLLLALWDSTAAGAKGGVGDFVNQAKSRALPLEIIPLDQVRMAR